MMIIRKWALAGLFLSLVTQCLAPTAFSADYDAYLCDDWYCGTCPVESADAGVFLITPDGSAESLEELGLTITVTIVGCNGEPYVGFPAEDIWLIPTSEEYALVAPLIADHDTDANGQTTFSRSIAGGIRMLPGPDGPVLQVRVGDLRNLGTLPVSVTSPDLNGDMVIDLADLGEFAADRQNDSYDFRSDLTHDGIENLADLGEFAQYYGEGMP